MLLKSLRPAFGLGLGQLCSNGVQGLRCRLEVEDGFVDLVVASCPSGWCVRDVSVDVG
jgi:hypothetical protein